MLFGGHHVLIAGTENLEDLGYTLSAVSHRSNGLNTANLEYLADSRNASSDENGRIHLAFAVGRRAEHNLLTTGNFSRRCEHEDGREEWGSTSRDVKTYAFDSDTLLPTGDAFLRLYLLTNEALRDVEHLNIMVCKDDGVTEFVTHEFLGFVHFLLGDSEVVQFRLVELQFILTDSNVTTLTDVSEHCGDCLVEFREVKTRTCHNLSPLVLFRIFIDLHNISFSTGEPSNTLKYHFFNRGNEDALCTHFLQLADNLPETLLVEYGMNRAPFLVG